MISKAISASNPAKPRLRLFLKNNMLSLNLLADLQSILMKMQSMKKTALCLAFTFISFLSIAQLQRVVTPRRVDSASAVKEKFNEDNKAGRKQMLRELNLTKEQRSKLKEIRQTNKAKTEAVNNNDSLTQEQKDAKLRELKREKAQSIMPVLNEEQKAKMKTMSAKKQKTHDN